ncbi:MAG: hypothetical protein R2706_19065 [Acidimicrobiales bacterium]
MALIADNTDQYEQLRNQLKRYEASLASAKDRLEAFSRLEAIAKERHQSPEVVAARAAIEILEGTSASLQAEVNALRSQREATQEELSMLLVSKKQATIDLEDVRSHREELADDVAGILNEIEAMRTDARRLQAEKAELETEVMEPAVVQASARRIAAPRVSHPPPPDDELVLADDEITDLEKAPRSAWVPTRTRFDRFFNAADIDDKARDWTLG